MGDDRQILALGGGSWVADRRFGLRLSALTRYALELSGTDRPKVCVLATAVGDDDHFTAQLYAAFNDAGARTSHLALFPMPTYADITAYLLDQDVVYVTGGNTANLLALWRLHGVDTALRKAWEAGVVLTGQSAGSLCWHAGGTTDSFGPDLVALPDGLGLVPYSHCPHYGGEEQRRPLYRRLVADGTLTAGYAADDGAAVHYVGQRVARVVSCRDGAAAYRVAPDGAGGAVEKRLDPDRID